MDSIITAAELAARLSDILDRIRDRGERFAIERDGERIATLAPAGAPSAITMREVAARLGTDFTLPGEDFAADLEGVQRAQSPIEPPAWPN